VPGAHAVHTALVLPAQAVLAYWPAAQTVHATQVLPLKYLPAAQPVQLVGETVHEPHDASQAAQVRSAATPQLMVSYCPAGQPTLHAVQLWVSLVPLPLHEVPLR
jgi:hypothetical protein